MAQRELVQISKTVNGVTLYGWKPVGTIDPMPSLIVWLPEGSDPGTLYEAYKMELSHYGSTTGTSTGRMGVCYTCQMEFPRKRMQKVLGKWYCKRCFKENFA